MIYKVTKVTKITIRNPVRKSMLVKHETRNLKAYRDHLEKKYNSIVELNYSEIQ